MKLHIILIILKYHLKYMQWNCLSSSFKHSELFLDIPCILFHMFIMQWISFVTLHWQLTHRDTKSGNLKNLQNSPHISKTVILLQLNYCFLWSIHCPVFLSEREREHNISGTESVPILKWQSAYPEGSMKRLLQVNGHLSNLTSLCGHCIFFFQNTRKWMKPRKPLVWTVI